MKRRRKRSTSVEIDEKRDEELMLAPGRKRHFFSFRSPLNGTHTKNTELAMASFAYSFPLKEIKMQVGNKIFCLLYHKQPVTRTRIRVVKL